MKFSKALPLLFSALAKQKIDFALVGGLALYTLGSARTTFDADFLILLSQAKPLEKMMKALGYELLHYTQDVANFVSKDPELGQVDYLFAHRKYATAMLKRAEPSTLIGHPVKVVSPEDLIGLKVQSSSNDPDRRQKDLMDIEEIMKKRRGSLDWALIEEYFRLFGREAECSELRKRLS